MSKIFVSASQSENKREIKLSNHVTPWLTFRECHQQKAFESFKTSQSSLNVFIGLNVVLITYALFSGWASYQYYPSNFSLAIFLLTLFTPTLVGIFIIAIQLYQRNISNNSLKNEQLASIARNLQSLWLFGTSVVFSLNIVLIGKNGFCDPGMDDFGKVQACNISSANQMPEDMVMISAIIPGLFAMMVKGAKWEYVIVTFLSNIFAVLFTMIKYDLMASLPSFLVFIPIAMIVMYENQRQSISLFLLTQSQKNLLEENERLAAETHANELRHMIGNVAHDLKTPLSAFINGVDLILGILDDTEEITSSYTAPLKAMLATVKETVFNMKNVNEFMLMTINRCIDYTKASNGLKLVPRLETVSLAETINLPLSCMRNMDNRIAIKMSPISEDVASHIITDKQWLQENILCLLSNAVKYSAGGEVDVSVSLSADAKFLLVEIEDTGIGISEEIRVNLFNQFKQAQRLAGGTGLGLYSLAKRVEALGGTYGVSARKDGKQGSLFWYTIPYRPDLSSTVANMLLASRQVSKLDINNRKSDELSVSEHTASRNLNKLLMESVSGHVREKVENVSKPPNSSGARQKLNILLVDDSLSIIKMSSMMLRRQGHTVTTADNGAVALRILTEQMMQNNSNTNNSSGGSTVLFDVVLMDLQMPIMDGLEATSRLRKEESLIKSSSGRSYHQMVIGVSACSDFETMEAAFAAGIDSFIPKPFNIQSFGDAYWNITSLCLCVSNIVRTG